MSKPRRTRTAARAGSGTLPQRLRRQLAGLVSALAEAEESGEFSPRARAAANAKIWSTRASLASCMGDQVLAERSSSHAIAWAQRAEQLDPPPIIDADSDAELEAAAQKAARFLIDAREAMLLAGFPADAIDPVFEDAKPAPDWRPRSIPALVAEAHRVFVAPRPGQDVAAGLAAVAATVDDSDVEP